MNFLSSADFFQNQLFKKILSGIPSECQTVCILVRPDMMLGLMLVQTVCKGDQQTTQVGNSFLVSGDFFHLLITFASSLDPDQAQHLLGLIRIGSELFDTLIVFLNDFFEKVDFDDKKSCKITYM